MSKHYVADTAVKTENEIVESVLEPEVEEVVEEVEEIVEPEVQEESKLGVVAGCKKLNVRAQASSTATVVCVINENSLVMIDEKESTADFYKVCTETGVEGFCMKGYITIKQ